MRSDVTILTGPPIVAVRAEMALVEEGGRAIADWVRSRRPECMPSGLEQTSLDLLPHGLDEDGRRLTDNEILAEEAGRKCYDSWGAVAGRKTNYAYLEHAKVHASISYHPHMTFFLAGVSRRLSHELVRNYVGHAKDEEGSPSQESTRYTEHYGFFVAPPYMSPEEADGPFRFMMSFAYKTYTEFIAHHSSAYEATTGHAPKGMDRKRLYEAAAALLPGAAETSFIWTTNPAALAKLFRERGAPEADAEFRRLVNDVWKPLCLKRWPNLFPGLT